MDVSFPPPLVLSANKTRDTATKRRRSRIWKEILSFSPPPPQEASLSEREAGVLRGFSPTTPDALVYLFDQKEERHVHMQWSSDRNSLSRLLDAQPKSFRIEVDVEGTSIVSLLLSVHPSRFADEMAANGTVTGEADLVSLVVFLSSSPSAFLSSSLLVSPPPPSSSPDSRLFSGKGGDDPEQPGAWKVPLLPHQLSALDWMKEVERGGTVSVGSLVSLPETGWSVDVADSCLVKDEERRVAVGGGRVHIPIRGGILSDGTGMGKTATALRLVFDSCPSTSSSTSTSSSSSSSPPSFSLPLPHRPTLAIVPLNLPTQWAAEVEKFCPSLSVTRLLTGRDARSNTLSTLSRSDLVLTTVSFLRNGTYTDMIDAELSPLLPQTSQCVRRSRRSALLSAWERRASKAPDDHPPLIEGVRWRRLLVDEIHELDAKTWSLLRGIRFDSVWGISATPSLDSPSLLLPLLTDVPSSSLSLLPSPLLLSSLYRSCIRGTPSPPLPKGSLCLVESVSDTLREETRDRPIEEAIRRVCAFTDCAPPLSGEGESSILTSSEAVSHPFPSFASQSIARLSERRDTCSLCEDRPCDAATPCGHVYCSTCLLRCIGLSSSCPACRSSLSSNDAHLVLTPSSSAKVVVLRDILSRSVSHAIVFAQWKETLRSIRSLLVRQQDESESEGGCSPPLLLDGNSLQRASTLSEFERRGGVLLICLSDSFSGLHLPQVDTILFAHALVGDRRSVSAVETQAVARAIRRGRRGKVNVIHLVLSDCAEEDLWRITHGVVRGKRT